MLPIKKILCPTDFSDSSFEALKVAEELALHFSAKLYLINVVNPIPVITEPTGPLTFNVSLYQKELEESAKKTLEDIRKNRISKQVSVQTIVAYGIAADEIVGTAETENIDLIVISTHGRTGFRHLISGSVTDKVIRISNHPVLAIRTAKKASTQPNISKGG
jgi:nucleotide-binding universal stress UspA family protein